MKALFQELKSKDENAILLIKEILDIMYSYMQVLNKEVSSAQTAPQAINDGQESLHVVDEDSQEYGPNAFESLDLDPRFEYLQVKTYSLSYD